MKTIQPFYEFRAEAGDEPQSAELLIFDAIGNWEEIGEISAKAFAKNLSELPTSVKRLDIHINSPGGSVFDAQAIYSRLADHRAEKIVYIDGLAASAASIVAMVGHKVYIRANANVMIHLPSAITMGNEDEHEKTIRALRAVTGGMINTYAKKTGLQRGQIRDMLAAETWFTAEEAVENGFADEVRGVVKAAAMLDERRAIFNGVTFDLSRFRNVPAFTGEQQKGNMQTKPKAENEPATEPPKPPPAEQPTPPAEQPPAEQPTPEHHETTPTDPPAQPAAAVKDYDKGVQAERARIAALQKHDRPATHDIITKAIAEGKTFADVAEQLFAALENAGNQQARRADASSLSSVPASDGGTGGKDDGFGAKVKERVKAKMKQRGSTRALFSRN